MGGVNLIFSSGVLSKSSSQSGMNSSKILLDRKVLYYDQNMPMKFRTHSDLQPNYTYFFSPVAVHDNPNTLSTRWIFGQIRHQLSKPRELRVHDIFAKAISYEFLST